MKPFPNNPVLTNWATNPITVSLAPKAGETKRWGLNGKFIFSIEQDRLSRDDFAFDAGPETTQGYLCDQHTNLDALEKLFADVPGIEWGAAESYHVVTMDEIDARAGTTVDPLVIWAIIRRRLERSGAEKADSADPSHKQALPPIAAQPAPASHPKPPAAPAGPFVPLADWRPTPDITTDDCKAFLRRIFSAAQTYGFPDWPQLANPAKWKRTRKYKNGDVQARDFANGGVTATIESRNGYLTLVAISGVDRVPTGVDLVGD